MMYFNSHFKNAILSDLVLSYDKMIIVGDFNFHVDRVNDYAAVEFLNITQYFDLLQRVKFYAQSWSYIGFGFYSWIGT